MMTTGQVPAGVLLSPADLSGEVAVEQTDDHTAQVEGEGQGTEHGGDRQQDSPHMIRYQGGRGGGGSLLH